MNGAARLVSNTAWTVAGRAFHVGVALFLTPYILTRLGREAFGLWALSRLLVGYLSLADLGIQASLVRQIAYALPHSDPKTFTRIVSTSFYFFFVAFLLFAGPAVWLGPDAVEFAAERDSDLIPPALLGEGSFVLTFTAATFFASIAISVLTSILPGLQRMDVSNQIIMGTGVLYLAGSVAALERGYGVSGLVVVAFTVRLLDAALGYWFARAIVPEFRLSPKWFDWQTWRELFSFGWKIQVSRLAELLAFTFDRLFVSFAGGVDMLGRYQPAIQVVTQARLLPFLLVSASLPYASELSAKKDRPTLLRLYFEGNRYLAFASFALIGFLAAAAPAVIRLWLGPGYDEVAIWIRIFCIGYLVNSPMSLGGLLSQAVGKPGIQATSAVLMGVLNVILAPAGFFLAELTGMTAGVTLALLVSSGWFFAALHRELQISSWEVVRRCFVGPAAWLLPAGLALGGAASAWLSPDDGRIPALIALLAGGIPYLCVCAAAAWRLGLAERLLRAAKPNAN